MDHNGYGYALAASPDGSRIATGDTGGAITLWRTDTWTKINSLLGHTDSVVDLAFSPDSLLLVSASRDNTARYGAVLMAKVSGN